MNTYVVICFFVYGLFFGSFYNLIGDRLPKGLSIIKPRSMCPNCQKVIKYYDLIPILSYIILRGKCRNCHSKISIFHPIIELLTGVLFAGSYYLFGFSYELLIAISLSSLFVIILVSDINYLIIPDEIVIFFSFFIMIVNYFNKGLIEALKSLGNGTILFLVMYILMMIGNKIFKKESLGGGDIKLMLVLGMCLPLIDAIFSIFLASCIALPISLILYFKNKDNIVPFGPFLILGVLIIYFAKININDIFNLLV